MPLVTMPKRIEGMNESEKRIINKLKQLYMSEQHISYLYLEPRIKNRFSALTPDFILIDPMRGVAIIEVKAWGIDYIKSINDKNIATANFRELENPVYKARRYFNVLKNIFESSKNLRYENRKLKFKLHSIVVFTKLEKNDIVNNNIGRFFEQYPARALYKDEISIDNIFVDGMKLIDSNMVNTIKFVIFPEIKIPNTNSLTSKNQPNKKVLTSDNTAPKNQLDKKVLGLDNTVSKNQLDKEILALDIEQERFVRSVPFGHYMITGLPGSGKTVALISRAIYLARLFPNWNILILTYNRTLKHQLELKIKSILDDLKILDTDINNIEVATFHKKAMEFGSLSPENFNDKEEFWRDILPNNAKSRVEATYDAILIDEYQDFYKNWFELVLKMVKTHKDKNGKMVKNMFFAGDRLQSIYNPREINWKRDIGLDMRGRSKLLKKSYRVTKEHIEFGVSLLLKDKKYKDEVKKFYEEMKDVNLINSINDSVEILESNNDGIVKRFQELLKEYSYNDILLLAPTWSRINDIEKLFPENIRLNIKSQKDILDDKKAIFTTYHSSKGIESKIVIVIDSDKIEERKLLYVASTRASSKLILHGTNFKNSQIGQDIIQIFTGIQKKYKSTPKNNSTDNKKESITEVESNKESNDISDKEINLDKIKELTSKRTYAPEGLWKIVEKTVREIEGNNGVLIFCYTLKDKCDKTSTETIRILNYFYYNNNILLPLGFIKTTPSKNRKGIIRRLFHMSLENHIKFKYVLMNSWTDLKVIVKYILKDKKHFIAMISDAKEFAISLQDKLNGTFKSIHEIQEANKNLVTGYIKELEKPILLYKRDNGRYIICSDTTLNKNQIEEIYNKRKKVEKWSNINNSGIE